MPNAKYIAQKDLAAWLAELAQDRRVLAPYREGAGKDAIVFRPLKQGEPMVLDRQATASPKAAVFPPSEELLRFAYTKSPDNPGQVDVRLGQPPKVEETLVFGCRPCDARGFITFDRVYDGNRHKDVYYVARRQKTLFATLVCPQVETSCFCHWVGSGPADTAGSDLLLTPQEKDGQPGYVIEAVSPKGEALLGSALLADASDAQHSQAKELQVSARQALGPAPMMRYAPKALLARFDDMFPIEGKGGFWEAMSAKCISCGACTYLCPTCYCFNITDETTGLFGTRVRSWDNCMAFNFTLEGSGHNPRPTKAHRLKNRVGHKFSYYPEIHGGAIACCGCGRCIKHCPSSVDIREIVLRAIEASGNSTAATEGAGK